jgi:hypothetical protein
LRAPEQRTPKRLSLAPGSVEGVELAVGPELDLGLGDEGIDRPPAVVHEDELAGHRATE